jgi:hypothetical protein
MQQQSTDMSAMHSRCKTSSTTASYLHTPTLAATLLHMIYLLLRSSFMVAISESMICASLGYTGFSVVARNKIRAVLLPMS